MAPAPPEHAGRTGPGRGGAQEQEGGKREKKWRRWCLASQPNPWMYIRKGDGEGQQGRLQHRTALHKTAQYALYRTAPRYHQTTVRNTAETPTALPLAVQLGFNQGPELLIVYPGNGQRRLPTTRRPTGYGEAGEEKGKRSP